MLHKIAFILLVIGGLNWLLTAFGWNVVAYLGDTLAMIVYILVGLSAIYEVVTHWGRCKECAKMPA
ncbi:MAG: hypothetical protein UY23_C0003G0025 [Candidatus Jorgensenbacteria bacterium GW2011_GWA1_48_11]|uniref:DUF378 domain-containing protein n=1 Tax=Candidatus Jorgensenbacteria bacterium GW2011_GWA1_48_11 TaxID=1618660 RepID=A0A0G1UAQ5_9BACT|nr:MAG: hypothetical protein UY23_C0003G0025 [Candidatus Jorgensenbacteria bacterium GW2011_GWA1_48_11]KKW11863.1 MAG: hypothetical protein UY51_C0005G0104 [Candidatus Jorgensenbacteria bacterium GW2011_GWB1_49_9]